MRSTIVIALALGGAGCGVHAADPPDVPVPVPFAVSDYYSPDGYWGDGETRGALVVDKSCPARAPGAVGDCYTITYRPGDHRFAGINWQYPHNNWGTQPGLPIAAGAARITLQARGQRGGEKLGVGAGQGGDHPHRDGFTIGPLDVDIGAQWGALAIPLGGQSYQGADGVIAAFVVSLNAGPDEQGPIVVYLDDLRWQP